MSSETADEERLLLAQLCRDYPYLDQACREQGGDATVRLAELMQSARGGRPLADAFRRLVQVLDVAAGTARTMTRLPGNPTPLGSAMVYVCPLGRCDRVGERVAGRTPRCQVGDVPLVHKRVET